MATLNEKIPNPEYRNFCWGGGGSGQLLSLIRKIYGPQLVFQCKEHREKPDDVMHPNKKLEQRWGATSGVLNVY